MNPKLPLGNNGVTGGFKFGTGFVAATILLGLVIAAIKSQGGGGSNMGWKQLGGGVRTLARLRQAILLANDVPKKHGENLSARVTWDQSTSDFQGNLISWPFRLSMKSLALVNTTSTPVVLVNQAPSLTVVTTLTHPLSSSVTPGTYPVTVTLEVQNSNSTGQPDGTWRVIDDQVFAGNVILSALTGPASVSGGIGNITLSQRTRHALRR